MSVPATHDNLMNHLAAPPILSYAYYSSSDRETRVAPPHSWRPPEPNNPPAHPHSPKECSTSQPDHYRKDPTSRASRTAENGRQVVFTNYQSIQREGS